MKLYTYDRLTGEYLGETDADPSPMEPGKFLVPAFATGTKPPAQAEGKVAVFDRVKGKWKLADRVVEAAPASASAPAVSVQDTMRAVVQAACNSMANALDFDSIEEAISYADEPAVPKYQMLARALRAWRSLVWFEFDRVLAEIKSGMPAPKDPDALLARLPKFVAPNTYELESVRSDAAAIPAEVQAFMKAQAERIAAEAEQRAIEAQRLADEAAASQSPNQPE